MIRVYEIHEQLSASLGDVVYCSNTNIPDGARYSKSLRDSYIYRAILETYRRIIVQMVGMPRSNIVAMLQSLLPNLTYSTIVTPQQLMLSDNTTPIPNEFWATLPKMIYVYNGTLIVSGHPTPQKGIGRININVVTESKLQAIISSHNSHLPDLSMCTTESFNTYANYNMANANQNFTMLRFYDYSGDLNQPANNVFVYGLKLPNNPSTALPWVSGITVWNYDSFVEIEDYMSQSVIALATMYALHDSQELTQTELFLSNQLTNLGRGQ